MGYNRKSAMSAKKSKPKKIIFKLKSKYSPEGKFHTTKKEFHSEDLITLMQWFNIQLVEKTTQKQVLLCLNGTKRDADLDTEKGQPKTDDNM